MFRQLVSIEQLSVIVLTSVIALTQVALAADSPKLSLVEKLAALEKKVDRLTALEEIRMLRLDYAEFEQAGNADGWVSLFTDDAVLSYGPDFGGEWHGKDALRENFLKWNDEPFNTMYVLTNPQITLTSDTSAYGHWTGTLYITKPPENSETATSGAPLDMVVVYEDEYRKVNGSWKISKLKLHFLWPERAFTGLDHPERR